MPFDPDAFLAEKQAAAPAAGTASGFDPDAFLASEGAAPAPEVPQSSPSSVESALRGATQGATAGFQDELSAGLSALVPTAVDKEAGRGFLDRYSMIRDQMRGENLAAQEAHPVVSALSEIAGSIPLAVAGSAGLSGLGAGAVTSAAAQGGLYGLGASKKESLEQAIKDTAVSSLLSAGIAKAGKTVGGLLAKEASPEVSIAQKGGDFEIKYGAGLKDSFKLGQEMKAALSSPETQQAISRELNAQQGNIANVIKTTKDSIGQKWAPLIEQHGDAPSDVSGVFSKIYDKISKIAPEGDQSAIELSKGLKARVESVENQLLQKSSSGSLKDVPLKSIAEAQEALGNIIFEQGAYRKNNAVNGAAKKFFGDLASAFEKADIEKGSGGDLTNINKMFSTLYKMQENKLTGAAISKLASDPQSTAALKAYDSFIKPLAELDPGVRSALAPDLDKYISNDFQKALLKAQLVKTVTGRSPSTTNEGVIGWALKKAYLGNGALDNIANKLGAVSGKAQAIPALKTIGSAVSGASSMGAPAIGALSTVK